MAVAHQAADSLTLEAKEAPKVDSKSKTCRKASPCLQEDQAAGSMPMGFLNSLRKGYEDAPKLKTCRKASPCSQEDQDAGSMLMGFLSSLRKGYEDALKIKDCIETETIASEKYSLSGQKRPASDEESKKIRHPTSHRVTPAPSTTTETFSVTTSYRADSSLEDFMSETDKGKDPSSSEDSDKDSFAERRCLEEQVSSVEHVYSEERGSVPPRKRMKGKGMVYEFTRKNVAKHNHTTTTERTETSSGTTTYRADSSLEDSDKGSSGERGSSEEQTSSEEQMSSEELLSLEERGSMPPRKRMKGMDMVCKFTRKNVAKHNHRMDAMRSKSTTDHSLPQS